MVKLTVPVAVRTGGGRREAISGFSASSRRTLLALVNSIDVEALAGATNFFVGLTFPGDPKWNTFCPRAAKEMLRAFIKRHRRAWGPLPIIWKLEPQKRGAPHFHLIVFGLPKVFCWNDYRAWIARNWYEVVGSDEPAHFRSGYSATKLESWGGVLSYAAKYVAKVCGSNWVNPGRFWGVEGRKLLPIRFKVQEVPGRRAVVMRRQLRRLAEHQKTGRYKVISEKGKVSRRWISPKHAEFLRVECGAQVVPYYRRLRRARANRDGSAPGMQGLTVFVGSDEFERLVQWVEREVPGGDVDYCF